MSYERSAIDGDILDLLREAREARDQEIIDRAKTAIEADDLIAQQASMPMLLGREALAVADRMRNLARPVRSHLPRFLGGSVLEILREPSYTDDFGNYVPVLSTPLLFATRPEDVGGAVVEASIYDGYTFKAPVSVADTRLFIEHDVVNANRDHTGPKRPDTYSISVDMDGPKIRKVSVSSERFAEYRVQANMEAVTAFHSFWNAHPTINPQAWDAPADLLRQYNELNRAACWDVEPEYPDDFYYLPLGLAQQALDMMGRTKQG